MAVTIQLRRDTHANLNSTNPNIASGEIVIDTTNNRAVVNSTSSTLAYNTAIAAGQFLTLDDSNGRTLGGGANEVQLSVKGASTQGDPIFQVTDNGGTNKIFSVTDNDTTICTIENHGDTADKVVQVIGQTGQKADGSGGSLLEVITESGDSTGLFVDNEGNVSILPADGEGEQAALLVKGSSAGDADAKIFEVQDEGGNQEFLVNDDGVNVVNKLKVDDITELTADHGIDIAKPITVTGNINASDGSKLLIQNHRGQTIITQTAAQTAGTVIDANTSSSVAALSATKLSDLAVTITPTSTSSKILIEACVSVGLRTDRPETIMATVVRTIGSTDTDLAGDNTSAAGDGGNSGTVKALVGPGSTTGVGGATLDLDGFMSYDIKHLDSPSSTDAVTYTFGLKSANDDTNQSDNAGQTFTLNKNNDGQSGTVHLINTISMIMVTEIPQ